jgi:hypothetical protein
MLTVNFAGKVKILYAISGFHCFAVEAFAVLYCKHGAGWYFVTEFQDYITLLSSMTKLSKFILPALIDPR